MNRFKAALLGLAASAMLSVPAFAALPWGAPGNVTVANSEVSGATPTCTYSATLSVCIEDMTANVTSLTLAGMTAGSYYSISFVQDGTGSRTLTQTPITAATGGPALPAVPSAANKYTTWVIKATSATAATFVQNYDNSPVFDSWNMAVATNGTAVAAGVMQGQTAAIFPGLTANNECVCQAQTLPATWQTGIVLGCLSATNSATCEEFNPTAGSITPAAITANIRVLP